MRLERLTDKNHPLYPAALALYGSSFPRHEQREAASQAAILQDGEYCFGLLYDEDAFVGLALYWETETFLYLEHFCILPEKRNRRYGQKGLELLLQSGKTVILEIDPPVDEISIRRKGFYTRCGFAENPYPHVHPPYHRGNRGHDLVVMTAPGSISRGEYDRFREYLECRVMRNVY